MESIFLRTFFLLITSAAFQFQAVAATTEELELVEGLIQWADPIRSPRAENPDLEFPKINTTLLEYLKKSNLNASAGSDKLKSATSKYCNWYAEEMRKETYRLVKISDLGEHYIATCKLLDVRLSKIRNVPFSVFVALNSGLPKKFDWQYSGYITGPHLKDIKKFEASIQAYNKSPLGLLNIPWELSHIIIQFMALGSLLLVIVMIFK